MAIIAITTVTITNKTNKGIPQINKANKGIGIPLKGNLLHNQINILNINV